MEATKKKRFRVSRWIFLSLAIIFNGFIVAYSCFSKDTANRFNNWVTNIFAKIVNNITEKEVEVIPITELLASLSNDKYNVIPGYKDNEIPLGSAKEITYSYLPSNATDKAVEFYTDNDELVILNSSGDKVSVVGMKVGTASISAKNKSTGLISSTQIKVVETVAPTSFDISLESTDIAIGSQATIDFDIDGGVLGHNELINFRYYDIRKLEFTSSDESVAMVNNYGVITPLSIGQSTITVNNPLSECSKSLTINVVDGVTPSLYSDLKIKGDNYCYGNDMLYDQTSHTHNHPLSIYDGDIKLDPDDFIWESSNELLAKVDKHGIVRGFRKLSVEDEEVTITAISKITGQSTSYNVAVMERIPSMIDFLITNGKQRVWNVVEYTACIGDDVNIYIYYDVSTSNKEVIAFSSDESVVQITNEGLSLSLQLKKEGAAKISVQSEVSKNLKFEFDITVLKAGAISGDDLDDMRFSIRKVVGHAALFTFAEASLIICLYMFLFNKKHCASMTLALSLLTELMLSTISEIIQNSIPGRDGNVRDVFINFAGAAVGALFVIIVFFIVKLVKRLKKSKQKQL